jgi:2-keto-4-pentenoate hydratase
MLADAADLRAPVPPMTEQFPDFDIEDAYAVQLAGIADRLAAGETVKGHKVGLTSVAMQRQFGVEEPDYGHLLAGMLVPDGAQVRADAYCQPRIEPEIGFVLADPLRGPGVSVADVLAATAFVTPALELIDSRIVDWRITLADTVADNASSAAVVLGGSRLPLDGLDLRLVGVVMRCNGEVVGTGAGGAVLGNPVTAVAWLVNKLAEFDAGLAAGEVVLPGSCTAAVPVGAGDVISAEFDGLGGVSVEFV